MTRALAFATSVESAFFSLSASCRYTEVELFRALVSSFASASSAVFAEEMHGAKHQVVFNPSYKWMRRRPRCELCDVMIVAYSNGRESAVRVTYLQAKLSKSLHANSFAASAKSIGVHRFQGNYEQWDLLSNRPVIHPTGRFNPPNDLLASAKLPSVGSFGVFHQLSSGGIDLFYVSADCLRPTSTPTRTNSRYGLLETTNGCSLRMTAGYQERTYSPTLKAFAKSLYMLEIGTPIFGVDSEGTRVDRPSHLNWLKQVTGRHSSRLETSTTLMGLMSLIGADSASENDEVRAGESSPPLIIIRVDE